MMNNTGSGKARVVIADAYMPDVNCCSIQRSGAQHFYHQENISVNFGNNDLLLVIILRLWMVLSFHNRCSLLLCTCDCSWAEFHQIPPSLLFTNDCAARFRLSQGIRLPYLDSDADPGYVVERFDCQMAGL